MCVVECIGRGVVQFYAVELEHCRYAFVPAYIEAADRSEFVFVSAVDNAGIRCDGKTCPILKVFARG